MIITEDILRSMVRTKLEEVLDTRMIEELAREVEPYFKEVLAEERRRLEVHMLLAGYDPALLEEGWMDTIADIGITAGQIVGGGVGMAAGLAGIAKYTPEFQQNVGGPFLDWFAPFISLFFSVQALIYPMPAIGSLKTIFIGLASGIRGIISGAGGLAAKGVKLIFQKGAGFISKAISLFGKAIKGIGKAIAAGGDKIVKLGEKLGGGTALKGMLKSLKVAMKEFMKRLKVLETGLKNIKNLSVKEIVVAAFKTSKGKLDGAMDIVKGSKVGQAVIAAKTKAGQAVTHVLGSIKYLKATDDVTNIVLKGTTTSGKSMKGFKITGITGGQIHMLNDAGKPMWVGADTAIKLMAKHPALKKWFVANIDDAGKAAVNTAIGVSGSTTRAAGKALGAAARSQAGKIPAYFTRVVGDSTKSANKWLMKYMAKNPQTMGKFIGTEVAGSVKGSKYYFQGINKAGKVMLTVNVKGGNLVAPFKATVSPAQFFAGYGKSFYELSSKSPYLQQFITHLTSFYPAKRAITDMSRAIAAQG